MKNWSWGGLEVSRKVEKLHSESVQHYLNGVLINVGALCNLVGNQIWNSLKLKHSKCESQESDEELLAYWVSHLEKQSLVFILI